MTLRVRFERYGEEALDAIAQEVRAFKGSDLMAPVTIIAHSSVFGLSLRRRLARDGVANLRSHTLSFLTSELATPLFEREGRRPSNRIVENAAIREALQMGAKDLLHPFWTRPSTVAAVARSARELDDVTEERLERLSKLNAQSEEVIGVIKEFRRISRNRWRHADAVALSTRGVEDGSITVRYLGGVIVALPQRLRPDEARFLQALANRIELCVVIGRCDDENADQLGLQMAEKLGHSITTTTSQLPHVDHVKCAPTPDAEVLVALRTLLQRADSGTPLEEMALLHGGNDPYPRLIHDELIRAGIPFNGPGVRRLKETVAARMLLSLLTLVLRGWHNRDLSAWLSSGPLFYDGEKIPTNTWERLARQAWVREGINSWDRRLEDLARRFEVDAPDEEKTARLKADAIKARKFRRATLEINKILSVNDVSMSQWAQIVGDLFTQLTGGILGQASWPNDEVLAANVIEETLISFANLDGVSERLVSLSEFVQALSAELELPAPQGGRFGRGLFVGAVETAVGLTFDSVWIVGMSDGVFPPRPIDDVLIPDEQRRRIDISIASRNAKTLESRRDLFAALAGARQRNLSFPAGDPRAGRALRPARFVLDVLSQMAKGPRLYARDIALGARPEGLTNTTYETIPSYFAAVIASEGALSETDYVRSALGAKFIENGSLSASDITHTQQLQRAIEVIESRRSTKVGAFSGEVGEGISSRALSATSLEEYATCPRRYFYSHLLGLSKTFTPEELLQLTPSERGRSIHRILENYGQALKQDEILRQTVSAARETMRQAVTDEFAMMSERQIVGHDAFWKLDRSHIEGLLLAFVEKDFEVRETYQSHITAVEETFGTPEPVKIELGKRVLDVRGQIDRIDVIDATNATKRRIYDYKTGKKVEMKTVDTFTGGVRLQLPLYALAMRRSPDELVEAAYWNFDGKPITKVLALTTHTEERLVEVIDTLASGIEEGIFPVYPGGSERGSNYDNCLFCDFDSICPKDRSNEWQRVSETSRLSSFRALKGTAAEVTGEVEE